MSNEEERGTIPCPNCQVPVPYGVVICTNCGWDASQPRAWPPRPAQQSQPATQPTRQLKPHRSAIDVFGSLILGGIAGGALAFYLFIFTGGKTWVWSWVLAIGIPLSFGAVMARTNRALASGVILGMAVVLAGIGACMYMFRGYSG